MNELTDKLRARENRKIRVLIADDHMILRQGLEMILTTDPNIEIAGSVEDGFQVISQAQLDKIDVVLMDISMPRLNGLETTRQLAKHAPHIKVLILSMYDNEEYVEALIEAGAMGYLLKDSSAQELLMAIEAVDRGDSYFSPLISRKLINGFLREKQRPIMEDCYGSLTKREQEILRLLSEARSNRDIADTLFISIKTVETHRAKIMKKLNLHTLAELVKFAIRKGLTKA